MTGHDLSYLLEVLNIADGETEDQLDEKLRTEANELGVDVESQHVSDQRHWRTHWVEQCQRSESVHSHTSRSTGMTSTYSDLSKDHNRMAAERRRSRASLSFRDYDAFMSKGVPNGRNSICFSPPSTPSYSTFSLPLSSPPSPFSSPKKHFRRIRGLSMLRLHRSDSVQSLVDGCPHCPQDFQSARRAVHKLPCGHRLCTQALRNTVKAATEKAQGAVPSCCGRPIPGALVEHVMTQEEQNALLEKLEQWDEAISLAPSISSSRRECRRDSHLPQRPGVPTRRSRTGSEESRLDQLSLEARHELEKLMEREDCKLLRTGQAEQRDRFLAWADKQLSEAQARHEQLRDAMKTQHEAAVEDLLEGHASAVAEAEDKQVKAECDMREYHVKERQDTATALRHMEAFCGGTYSNGEPHNRTITEHDRAELDKARRAWSQMDAKHESAINVLRGEQGRRLRLRAQRQEREVQELKRQQRREELEQERGFTSELSGLDESKSEKGGKIRWRWELQMSILGKKIEAEIGETLNVRLPSAEWKSRSQRNSATAHALRAADKTRGLHATTTTTITMHGDGNGNGNGNGNGASHLSQFKIVC
ncbi:uncharacterized protein MYCFIDRAFT_77311 [Pseudocercospora fijiensis CIRAD86]|uniref:RING-type domain-containing protein n=1 Tax=Pseudocercospora fijiensis (strain CIRAD86) TaxID=383855 RepID=M2ZAN8_PSEFD|nr:uncharacterized protein MYCFIDRAFT_77311 [Pseudocercospora fijiensis CIRAD86]EME86885.1 hypothetical protein MYCFIDRAFT_77311 [Pseudocercospora fijiensis CIRAD86]